jgi:predicted ATPase/DNA-binding winged helix-turn-helix (wHTH) protein
MVASAAYELQFDVYRLPQGIDLLYSGDEVVPLEPRAVRLLRYLLEQHDRVISKEELLENVWADVFTTDGVLKRAVSHIRRTLGDDADQARFIATYHGRGYRFIAPVARMVNGRSNGQPVTDAPAAPHAASPDGELIPMYDQFAGRDTELAALRAEFRAATGGNPRAVVVVGEAGIGKTHLIRHFRRWSADQGAISLQGRFFDYRGARLAPYELFLDLLSDAVGFAGTRPAGTELMKEIEAQCGVRLPADLFTDDEATAAVPPRLAIASAGDHFRFVVPITRCLLAIAKKQPLVLVFDDVQWADQASLDVVGCLMRSLQAEPILIVVLVRSDEAEARDHPVRQWLAENAVTRSYTTIRLERLDAKVCREIIAEIFGVGAESEVPPNDLDAIYRLTEGNPYFLVETLRLLVTGKAIIPDLETGRWRWKGVDKLALPETIANAARAKIDRASDALRQLIDEAAVVGDEFRVTTLCAMTGRNEPEIEELLSAGVRGAIFSIQTLSPGEDCRFQHSLLRQVVYDAIPPQRKRRLHARAAAAIESVYTGERDRMAEVLSAHYLGAGDAERAFEASMHAWRIAASRSEWLEAVVLIERAECVAAELQRSDEKALAENEKLELLIAHGETWNAVGRIREAAVVLDRALARSDIPPGTLARLLVIRAQTAVGLSHYDEARSFAARALELLRQSSDHDGIRRSLTQLASIEAAVGNYDEAERLASAALTSAASDGIAAHALALLGWSNALRGRYEEGSVLLERALELLEGSGSLRNRALVLRRLHWVELSRGRYERAIHLAGRAREDSITIGDVNGEAKANMGIGQSRIAQGLFDEGIVFLNRAFERLKVIGDAHCEAESLWLLARAHAESARIGEAAPILERALKMIRTIGDRDDEFRMMIDLARLDIARGSLSSARAGAREAMRIAESLTNHEGAALALIEQARVDLTTGAVEAAIDQASRAVSILDACSSGERWRGYATLSAAHAAARHSGAARDAMQQAVSLLAGIRNELPPGDAGRRLTITKNRSAPARELSRLLAAEGRTADAAALAREWGLDDPGDVSQLN